MKEIMAKKVMEKLEDELKCSICLETYNSPKLLHCLHICCQECLVRLVARGQEGQDSISCPVCRQVTPVDSATGVGGLQSAFHINRLLELKKSVEKIQDSTGMEKELASSGPAPLVNHCSEHEQQLKLYCNTCEKLICCECAIKNGKHHDHEYEQIKDSFEKYKRKITSSSTVLEKQCAAVNEALVQLEQVSSKISTQQVTVKADVHSRVRKLHELIDTRETELIRELDESTRARLKDVAAQRDEIEALQARLDSCLGFIKGSLETDNQGDVLLMKSSVVNQIDELSTSLKSDTLCCAEVNFLLCPDITTTCKIFRKLLADIQVQSKFATAPAAGLSSSLLYKNSQRSKCIPQSPKAQATVSRYQLIRRRFELDAECKVRETAFQSPLVDRQKYTSSPPSRNQRHSLGARRMSPPTPHGNRRHSHEYTTRISPPPPPPPLRKQSLKHTTGACPSNRRWSSGDCDIKITAKVPSKPLPPPKPTPQPSKKKGKYT